VNELAVIPPPEPDVVHQTLAARSAEVDERVRSAYAQTIEPLHPAGLALVAVGGFGRRELFPHSDVDLLLLVDSDQNTPPRPLISAFLQTLWDSGLRPSHSVHSLADCVVEHSDNAEFTISLLDHRSLAGDQALYKLFEERFKQFRTKRAAALARQVAGLAEGRRSKYQKTIYHLEPNVKETPGGLRDLQTARWLQILEPHAGTPDVTAAFAFLAGIRLRLHERNGRDQNALSFDLQEMLSEHPAALMRDY
jgi:[protein-PII] uridylyltransferase